MQLASYRHRGRPSFGLRLGDGLADLSGPLAGRAATLRDVLQADLLPEVARLAGGLSADLAIADVSFLPILPDADKIVCIGHNYRAHVAEIGAAEPAAPRFFLKHMSALVGHGQPLVRPAISDHLDYEGELAIVIGRPGRYIAAEHAMPHVGGYTCLNDGSVRDYQEQNLISGKNFPGSGSIGPWLTTADEIADPAALTLVTRVNGEERQRSSTGLLIVDIARLISIISEWTPLLPGNIIATGTPAGVGFRRQPPLWLKPGDRLEIEIDGLGTLANDVVAEARP